MLYQLPMEGAKVILEASVTKCKVDSISASLRGSKNLEEALQSGKEREREREREREDSSCEVILVYVCVHYAWFQCMY